MKILLIDLFCGAGGTTTGVMKAKVFGKTVAKVIACVNHDPVAIASHKANHKGTMHFNEDIRTLDLTGIITRVKLYKQQHPDWPVCIWASLECTNFSNAKGGQPRDADSRTLAEHLHRYIGEIKPDYIFIENVVEFMSWGPLDKNNKPLSRDKGRDYLKWVDDICTHFGTNRSVANYQYQYRILNSADFGAYTSRKRYFGIFAASGLPISFPPATHTKKPVAEEILFSNPLKKWKPVKDVLDFSDEGNTIFRDKSLSEKTLERIYAGLIKYVANGDESFIAKYFSGRPKGKCISVNQPAGTITTSANQSLINCNFITQRNSGDPNSKLVSVEGPARTITGTGGNQDLVTCKFLLKYNSTNQNGKHTPPSVEDPCPVIACQNRLGLVSCSFMMNYYSNGGELNSIESPSGTVTTKDRSAIVKPCFWLDKAYSGSSNHQSVEVPAGTILTKDKYFLMNPQWFGNNGNINQPCCTLIARQDKAPMYLVSAINGEYQIPVYESDSEAMIKIKQFMAAYGICDIKMRMLKVAELLKIQGFPDQYILRGNQAQQKKFIGNSVVPKMAELLIKAIYMRLLEHLEIKVAA